MHAMRGHIGPSTHRVQSQFTQHSKASLEILLWKVWTMQQHVQDAYITCYEKLYDFLTDQTKVIKDFQVLDMGTIGMEYVQIEEF